MENHSYSSYPESGNSSPRSREIDSDNAAWEEPAVASYRVKFMCSYGGKISPRSHDNQLSYVGGDTKILTVDRNIRYGAMVSKLASFVDSSSKICFKYQLPGEDLDALISVTNDEDLDHMMVEYDRLFRTYAKPARLRLFLFPVSAYYSPNSAASDGRWFVDALNSAPTLPAPAAAATDPDFLFGLEKTPHSADPVPDLAVTEAAAAEARLEKDELSAVEIQRQIQELQRLQIANQRRNEEAPPPPPRALQPEYYQSKPQESVSVPASASVSVPVAMPTSYWTDRQMHPTGFTTTAATGTGTEQPMYFLQAPMYRPPVAGQGYYVQRMLPEMYRDPTAMYGAAAAAAAAPSLAQNLGPYGEGPVRHPSPVPTAAYDNGEASFLQRCAGGGSSTVPDGYGVERGGWR